ncbi:hypothetical protein A3A49_00735 [Candidatus Curtissbacteria bacterium RIFCSPLOWO2_01_FULL_38_11b]|uniref:Pyrrolo-quinoline quinone repeat domain-containing protein n=1 Tax=Candidatus Curtissbacteria bacterium RIFCSPLOWO2_01_FULL_38_11b TaxID=1797725 RepID=A0A1F5H1R6_9BACT|nr:MAG: hypothetical protein A3A49_00735 [Candidatus Curtissbacteria bacterium RIFCSPLOWO2_01_FULL_38_11b]
MENETQNINTAKPRRLLDFLILIIFIAVTLTIFFVFNNRDKGMEEKIIWKFDTGIEKGELSEPVVQNGNIFLAVNTRGKNKAYIVSVGEDGKERWKAQFDSEKERLGGGYDEVRILGFSEENTYIYQDGFVSVLNSEDGKIINKYVGGGFYHDGLIFSGGEGLLKAVNADDGSQKWQFIIPERTWAFQGQYTYGNNNLLYIKMGYDSNDDGQRNQEILMALDTLTGQEKWNSQISNIKSASNIFLNANQLLYRIIGENEISRIDANTGKKLQSVSLQNFVAEFGSDWFYVNKGIAFARRGTGREENFLYAFDSTNGNLKWKYDFQNNSVVGIESDELIYLTSEKALLGTGRGKIDAIDPNTGKKAWHYEFGGDASISKPVLSENRVYVTAGNSLRDGEFLYALSK